MYLVDISKEDIYEKLFKEFKLSYLECKKYNSKDWDAFLEKDKLIGVSWSNLFNSLDPKSSQPLTPIKWSGKENNEKIELRDIFVLLLKGISCLNRLQDNQLESRFPLGVFVFGTKQLYLHTRVFKDLDISPKEKQDFNERVMVHLECKKAIEKEQKQAKKVDAKLTVQIIPKQETQRTLTQEESQNLVVGGHMLTPTQQPTQQPINNRDQIDQKLLNFIPQEKPGLFASIGTFIWSGITKLTNLMSNFLNWIGSAYPQ